MVRWWTEGLCEYCQTRPLYLGKSHDPMIFSSWDCLLYFWPRPSLDRNLPKIAFNLGKWLICLQRRSIVRTVTRLVCAFCLTWELALHWLTFSILNPSFEISIFRVEREPHHPWDPVTINFPHSRCHSVRSNFHHYKFMSIMYVSSPDWDLSNSRNSPFTER